MKRLCCAALCILLLLAALPATAYTEQEARPVQISLRVMEPQTDIMGGQIFAEPAPGRRYVRNEVLAVMVSLDVPRGVDPVREGYTRLLLSVQGGDVRIPENFPNGEAAAPVLHYGEGVPRDLQASLHYPQAGFVLPLGGAAGEASAFYDEESDRSYKIAFFCKLTSSSAVFTASLSAGGFVPDASDLHTSHLRLETELGGFAVTRNTAPMIVEGAAYTNKTLYTVEEQQTGSRMLLVANKTTDRVEDLLLCYRPGGESYTNYRMIPVQGQPCFVLASPIWGGEAPLVARAEGAEESEAAYRELWSVYRSLAQEVFGLDWEQQSYAGEALLAAPLLQEDVVAELVVNAG